jgi:hypothetical protein
MKAAITRKNDIDLTAGISLGVLCFKPSFCRIGETAHMKATRREARKPHKGILPTFEYRLSQNHHRVPIPTRIFSRRAAYRTIILAQIFAPVNRSFAKVPEVSGAVFAWASTY